VAPYSYIGSGRYSYLLFYADNNTNDNEVSFGLSAGGDSISLFSGNGSLIDSVEFDDQSEDVSQGRFPDGSNSLRSLNTATPGESNLIRYTGLVVNELLAHTDPPLEDAVEFHNQTDQPVDISGWYLSDSANALQKYRIPDGSVVPAKGY